MNPNILIIDDSKDIRLAIRSLINKKFKVIIEESDSGFGAIEKIKNKDFDIIVCDLKMSEGTGLDVFYYLINNKPDLISKFIFFSASSSILRIFRESPCICIQKPNFDLLLKAIEDLFLKKLGKQKI